MKYLGQIQCEFLKQADMSWDRLSLEQQRRYLKEHPKSKRRLTGVSIRDKLQRQEESELARPWIDKFINADDYHNLLQSSTNLRKGSSYTIKEPFEVYQMTKTEANPNDMIGTATRHKMWLQKINIKAGDKLTADSYSNEVFLNDDRDHPLFINKPHTPTFQEYPTNKLEKL